MAVKYVFVTGGVVSGLGKGITAASLGRLLKMRGYRVTMQKFDPYINIDPGTMNPIQHGEVFVTDDGAETDLDLGHYERFIDESLTKQSNVTTGKVYWSVLSKERRGDYGGGNQQAHGPSPGPGLGLGLIVVFGIHNVIHSNLLYSGWGIGGISAQFHVLRRIAVQQVRNITLHGETPPLSKCLSASSGPAGVWS